MPKARRPKTKVRPFRRRPRAAVASMLLRLFSKWQLSPKDQRTLLGQVGRAKIKASELDEWLRVTADTRLRAGHLFAIYKNLAILFPKNPEIVFTWPTSPNRALRGQRPLRIMKTQSIAGLMRVRMHTDAMVANG